jgi:hypothetical protein
VLIAGGPVSIIVVICLCFHLTKAFTVDDTIFLRIAEQAIQTPTRPLEFDMCWDGAVKRFSQFIAHAPLMGYVLIPAVRSDNPELIGHLLQLVLLILSIFATASLAFRLGLRPREALIAATLVGTCPAVLGMAATVMPDVLAMSLGVVAVERFAAWQQGGRPLNAIVATLTLALAPLARPQMALLFAVCVLIAMPDISLAKPGMTFRRMLPPLVLVAISGVIYLGATLATREALAGGLVLHRELIQISPRRILDRTYSLGCYLSLTTPLVAGVLVSALRLPSRAAVAVCAIVTALTAALFPRYRLLIISGAAYLALAGIVLRLCKSRTGPALALAVWAVIPLSTVLYLHTSAKYLVPSVPAYALLLAFLARDADRMTLWMYGALAVAGLTLGLLIVCGDARFANLARSAVNKWLPPLRAQDQRVLFQGHWGFQWYAEKLQATCFNPDEPGHARKGDWVVVGISERRPFPRHLYPTSRLVDVIADKKPGSIVLDDKHNVGFFSDYLGRLPWSWASSERLRYELWRIE